MARGKVPSALDRLKPSYQLDEKKAQASGLKPKFLPGGRKGEPTSLSGSNVESQSFSPESRVLSLFNCFLTQDPGLRTVDWDI